jgi:hypothetical protein
MAWFSDGGKQHMHKYFIMCSRCGGKRDIYHYGIIWSLCGGQQHIGHFYVEVNNTSAIFMVLVFFVVGRRDQFMFMIWSLC